MPEKLHRHPITVDRQCYDLQRDRYIRIAASGSAYTPTAAGRDRITGPANSGERERSGPANSGPPYR